MEEYCVTAYASMKTLLPAGLGEGCLERRKKLNEKSRRAYVEGMRRYQEQGVRVLIDGKDADDELWEKVFEIRQDGGFYMGDYVLEEVSIPIKDAGVLSGAASREQPGPQPDMIRESPAEYGTKKKLKEIRFDIVYHR